MSKEQSHNPKAAAAAAAATTRRRGHGIFGSVSVAHVDDNDDNVFGDTNSVSSEKLLSNGDYYSGDWSGRLPHGHGKYLWTDGCMFVGEWYKGRTMGKGRFCWPSGATYEGDFRNGFMDGAGTYTSPPGDTYRGSWAMNLKHGKGTKAYVNGDFYEGEWWRGLRHGRGRYRWRNGNCYIGQWKNGAINGNGMMIFGNGNMYDGFWEDGMPRGMPTRHRQMRIQTVKRQGETISKGHKNYELMLNLQLGIRHSVSRPASANSLDPKPSAFDQKEKVQTKFPAEGSKHTPPHQSCEFRWIDYCPVVFRALRKLFEIDAADYMISLCGDDALRELSSPGKSGSFFYLTNDDRYLIKTIKKAEVKALLRMLPAYYKHVRKYRNTLLTKFFGLHRVKLTGATQKKVRFVIMGNLFCSRTSIHRCFDLKGSSHGRVAEKPETEIHMSTTLKDLDLNFLFRLPKFTFQEFRRQVDTDCDFLEQERIMDYSLLVGLHFRNVSNEKDLILARPIDSRKNTEGGQIISSRAPFNRPLGENVLARAELTERPRGEPTGEMYEVSLSFGIIDILQDYDISKKLEHAYKSMQYDPTSISAVDPRQYSRRFRDFVMKVFVEDDI